MNIGLNINTKFTQWFNSLPVAKNMASQNSGVLNHNETTNVPTSLKKSAPIEIVF